MFLESGDMMQEKSLGKTIFFLILSIVLATIALIVGYSIAGFVIKSSWNYLAVNLFDSRFGLIGTVFDGAMISLATSWIVEPKWGTSTAKLFISHFENDEDFDEMYTKVYGFGLYLYTCILMLVVSYKALAYTCATIIPSVFGITVPPITVPIAICMFLLYTFVLHKELFAKTKNSKD